MYELDLSIIILNWNTAKRLDGCIGSLIHNAGDVSYEAYVIDNNSKGDSFDKVVDKYKGNPNIIWIKNEENIGGIANNRVFPKLRGRYVMLLGNDTLIMPLCFRKLVDFMDTHEDAGAASAKLLNPNGSVQHYYARFHDLPMFFWRATIIGQTLDKLFCHGKHAKYYWYSDLDPEKLNVVDQPPGPCLIIRRANFIKDYFIDEQIPLYFSDVDLCRRIYLDGYKIYVLPSAEIIHYPGSSFKKADQKWAEKEYRKSLLWYFQKYYPQQVLILRFLLLIDSLPQYIYKKLHDRDIYLLRKELGDCDSILDLGCGNNSPIQYINAAYTLGIDNGEQNIKESEDKTIHTEYLRADIREIKFNDDSFDAVLILDVIEYLDKEAGRSLMDRAGKWARKKVIVSVPNNYQYMGKVKSVWEESELKKLGFTTYGLGGWRGLYTREGKIKYTPQALWKAISFICQPLYFRLPRLAFLLYGINKAGEKCDRQ